jgi:serine/threonine-protein kinase
MTLTAGTKLGRYEIRSKIGEGGMGEVYLTRDTKLDRTVALKILPFELASNRDRMNRFVQEAKAASALNHPNIITIYEIDETDSGHFIAIEFIDGETLRQLIQRAPMKLGEVLDIAAQIGSALSAAHAAGIIHRDIKPENVMLRRDGIVKVLDFGLAKLTERPSPDSVDTEAPTRANIKTDPGVVMGTTIYMSPEQASGMKVDARTDIFSLGVLIYELVAGRLPFAGSNPNEVLVSILNDKEPLPLARYAREVPAELERIVEKALRKDREQRYQTMKDLLLDLQSLKHRLEFQAELERSTPPQVDTVKAVTTGAQGRAETLRQPAPQDTSGGQYAVHKIMRHRTAAVIALAALAALAATGYFYFSKSNNSAGGGSEINSIAILPFVNVNANADTEYLSDGLTDSLINSLSQAPKLKVIARASVFSYKAKETDPQAVGRELKVQGVVTGRITQRGDNLSISVELTDARDKSHIWGEQYNRKLSDLIAVQEEISSDISNKLRLKLTGEEQKRLTKRYTDNVEAYQLYLKGRHFADQFNEEGFKKAVEHFDQAIGKDPNYALAYAGLAEAYWIASAESLPPREAMPKARQAAMNALKIDDQLAEAHTLLAVVLALYDYDLSGGEREFKRAIELNPNSALAHQWYGHYLASLARADEALKEIRRAQELDPLSLVINTELGIPFYITRQYDQAIEQFKKVLEMDPNMEFARFFLGWAYAQKGMYEEAIAMLSKPESDHPFVLGTLAQNYALSGRKSEALKLIDRLNEQTKHRYVAAYSVAPIYLALGNKGQALQWLEKSYENREDGFIWINTDPAWDGLRSDPRFQELARRVRSPQ